MLKAFIVDDEKPALDLLSLLISSTGIAQVTGQFDCAQAALEQARQTPPDVAFLDIEMPGMSGIELAEQLSGCCPDTEIVFVTAYDQYALDAFRTNALDYLLKPISPQYLRRALNRVLRRKSLWPYTPPATQAYIQCLGGFLLFADAQRTTPLRWRTAKSRELFALLYVNKERWLSKFEIIDTLWPEAVDDDKTTNRLHTTVYKMKKTLTDAGLPITVNCTGGSYRLQELHSIISDAEEFESLLAQQLSPSPESQDIYERALALYRGDFMEGLDYFWAYPQAQRLRRMFMGASRMLSMYYSHRGEQARAHAVLEQAVGISPPDEETYAMLLDFYFATGDRSAYIRHYQLMEKALSDDLGIQPAPRLRKIYREYLTQAPK